MTPRLPVALAGAALLLSAALAGCSTGGATGGSISGSPSAAASAASKAPAASAAFKIPTTCLSAAEVSGLLGLPEAGPTMTAETNQLICEYLTATQDGAIINYQTKPGASAASLAAEMAANPPADATVTPIAHLGDAAYEVDAAGSTGILMVTGSTIIDVAGGGASIERVEALALDVLAG
jgi:hypothetical protein